MIIKTVFVAFALLAGCLAFPTPDETVETTTDNVRSYISNGTRAKLGTHPHMVALTVGPVVQALFCGASLITQRTVLTAGHCIDVVYMDGALVSSLRMTVGTNRWDSGGQTYSIDRNITHPHFVRPTLRNDIGLLFTTADVVLSNLVQTIHLTYDDIPGGVMANVAGWGRIGNNEPNSDNLLELYVPTISGQECTDRYIPFRIQRNGLMMRSIPTIEPKLEICTYYSRGSGFCGGDSGSALIRVADGRQIGVVSWGILCARGAPDVYARISGHAEWLQKNII